MCDITITQVTLRYLIDSSCSALSAVSRKCKRKTGRVDVRKRETNWERERHTHTAKRRTNTHTTAILFLTWQHPRPDHDICHTHTHLIDEKHVVSLAGFIMSHYKSDVFGTRGLTYRYQKQTLTEEHNSRSVHPGWKHEI